MITRYYEIARLVEGKSLFVSGEGLTVVLSDAPLLENDKQLHRAIHPSSYFWVSGGGTYLLNDRFLPIVQRAHQQTTNPGKWSLFTGRADTHEERANPELLVRELFEELILLQEGVPLLPKTVDYQEIVLRAWSDSGLEVLREGPPPISMDLTSVPLKASVVEIALGSAKCRKSLSFHINSRNEINVLFVFATTVDLEALTAIDGECVDGRLLNRTIALFDLYRSSIRSLAAPRGPWQRIEEGSMSEHLREVVNQLRTLIG